MSLMRARRSIRHFRPDPIPGELLEQVLEGARWAPSAGNRQAYRFLVIQSSEIIEAMGREVRAATDRLAEHLRPDFVQQAAAYLENFHCFAGAPVVLVPIYRTGFDVMRAVADEHRAPLPGTKPVIDALASVSAAITHLLLSAHALGLGSCWMTGPLIASRELSARLQLPTGWDIAALIPLGFPAEEPPERSRRPLSQMVRHLGPGR